MDVKFSYESHTRSLGGQHTNGPDYGIFKCEHLPSKTVIEVDTYLTRGQGRARSLCLDVLSLILDELKSK